MPKAIVLVVGANYPRYERVSGQREKTVWEIRDFAKKRALWAGPWRRMAVDYAAHVIKREQQRAKADRSVFLMIDVFRGLLQTFQAIKNGEPVADPAPSGPHPEAPKLENYRRLVGKLGELNTVLEPLKPRVTAPNARVLFFPGLDTNGPVTVAEYVAKFQAAEAAKLPMDLTLGVIDVYTAMLQLPRDTIRELHVFSHGIRQGPILLNTPVFNPNPQVKSFGDKDGRPKDFAIVDGLLKQAGKPLFGSRFTSDAFSVLWGCSADSRLDELIRYAESATNKDASGMMKRFTIEFTPDDDSTPDQEEEQRAEFKRIWKGEMKWGKLQRELTRRDFAETFKNVLIPETYAKQLALASGRPVFAALPGTSSNYDDAKKKRAPLVLTHIPQKLVPEDNGRTLIDVLTFYAKRLGITFELSRTAHLGDTPGAFSKDFGRGFAKYSP